jgi:hypothetical protein
MVLARHEQLAPLAPHQYAARDTNDRHRRMHNSLWILHQPVQIQSPDRVPAIVIAGFFPLANLSNLLSLNRRRLAKHKPLYLFDASNLANLSNLKTP